MNIRMYMQKSNKYRIFSLIPLDSLLNNRNVKDINYQGSTPRLPQGYLKVNKQKEMLH